MFSVVMIFWKPSGDDVHDEMACGVRVLTPEMTRGCLELELEFQLDQPRALSVFIVRSIRRPPPRNLTVFTDESKPFKIRAILRGKRSVQTLTTRLVRAARIRDKSYPIVHRPLSNVDSVCSDASFVFLFLKTPLSHEHLHALRRRQQLYFQYVVSYRYVTHPRLSCLLSNQLAEISPNNRATCQATHCKKEGTRVDKTTLRQGTLVTIQEHTGWKYRHW